MCAINRVLCRVLPPLAAVELGSKERMVAFCRAVQQCCPIGSYIQPVPGA
jgi:cystathionine beta-lyase family protein involved in aluminum resistance